jgi:hypothetical protein
MPAVAVAAVKVLRFNVQMSECANVLMNLRDHC